jgi:hypothetical protein
MRGVYSGHVVHNSLMTAKNLLVLTSSSVRIIELLRASVTNITEEIGEQLRISLWRATAAGTGAATAITKIKHEFWDQASSSVLEHTYAITEPTLDTDPIFSLGISSLAGWYHDPIPEERIYVPTGGRLVLRLDVAPATAVSLCAGITWREIG